MKHNEQKEIFRKDFTAVILAGGKSRRMGGIDKTKMIFDGYTLVQNAINIVEPHFHKTIVAEGKPGRLKNLTVNTVADRYAEIGPLAGIHAALKECETQWLFVVAADMPSINHCLIKKVLNAANNDSLAVIPQNPDGKIEPLHGAYHKKLLPKIEHFIKNGHRKILNLFKDQPVHYLKINHQDLRCFRNINNPEDVAAWKTAKRD